MSELWHSFLTNRARVTHKWTHYFPIYERHFSRFKDSSCVVVEIGCGRGGSLQMWKRYFGPHASIVGIDIDPACKQFEEDQIQVFVGDQASTAFLGDVLAAVGQPDVVIDDGSHVMSHIGASFQFLYPKLAKNGVYLVEDLHTAYWEEFEGGYLRAGSFIENSKSMVDSLNAYHSRGAVAADEFARTTMSIHFYDSVVVFERGAHRLTNAPMIGAVDADSGKDPGTTPAQPEIEANEQDFDEQGYLASNPDVARAVSLGEFQSGLEHFKRFGHDEKRRMRRSANPPRG